MRRRTFLATGMAGAVAAVVLADPAQARRMHGAVLLPTDPTPIVVGSGWTGDYDTGGSPQTASTTPRGTGLDIFKTVGAFTWQADREYISDTSHIGLIHGGQPSDGIPLPLDHVEVYFESNTPVILNMMTWRPEFSCFGDAVSLRGNGLRNGLARGYIRYVATNGLERVESFTVWINDTPGAPGYVDRTARAVYVQATSGGSVGGAGADNVTTNGTSSASPYATAQFALINQTSGTGPGGAVNRDGGYVYLLPGMHLVDTAPGGSIVNTRYPTEVRPAPGFGVSDVTISASTRTVINWQAWSLVMRNVSIDPSRIYSHQGQPRFHYLQSCYAIDPNPNIRGPETTVNGQAVPECYYQDNSTNTGQEWMKRQIGSFVKRSGAFNCRVRMLAFTGFDQIVNITGPDGVGPAEMNWDILYTATSHSADYPTTWVFNYQARKINQSRIRRHLALSLPVNGAPSYSGGTGKTTIPLDGSATTISGIVSDVGCYFLDGAYAGQDSGFQPTNAFTLSSGSTYNLVVLGDFSGAQIGDTIRVYSVAHPDAMQMNNTPSDASLSPNLENVYVQNYQCATAPGDADLQVLFPQMNTTTRPTSWAGITFSSSGTSLTASGSVTLRYGDFLHDPTTHGYAMVVGSGPGYVATGTTFTLDQPFNAGDISGAACSLGKSVLGALFINCVFWKDGIDNQQGQIQGGIVGMAFVASTIYSRTTSVAAGNSCINLINHAGQFGLRRLGFHGSIVKKIGYQFTAVSTADLIGYLSHFVDNSSVPAGATGAVGALTFDASYAPLGATGVVCDAALSAAAPWDRLGNARRVGDPVGALARSA